MKEIDLFGLGHALVDIQIEVSETELGTTGYKKGSMTLTDSSEQNKIIEMFSDKKHLLSSGGSAANTIKAFSGFGGRSAYKTKLGQDRFGEFYAKEFQDLNIKLLADNSTEIPTGRCIVLITPDSERTMITDLGASANFEFEDNDLDLISESEWLYLEGYKFASENGTDVSIRAAKVAYKQRTKIALTFSDTFITDNFRDNLAKLPPVDLVFCNESEALSYTRSKNVDEAMEKLSENFNNVIITQGSGGSTVKWDGKILTINPVPTKAKDTTGAGDMFAGAFLYGITSSNDPEKSGNLASLASSLIVSQYGARFFGNFAELKIKSGL